MKWLKKSLKPSWTFKSNLKVWRLFPGSGVLVAELRNPDEKVTEFVGIDLSTGSRLWKNDQLAEKWWTTLNKIYRDVLFLHQFVRPDMPTPGKIFAVDLYTGKLLWQNDELSYLDVSDDIVFGLRTTLQSEDVIGLDYRSGEEIKAFSADDYRTQDFPAPEDELILAEPFDVNTTSGSVPAGVKMPMIIRLHDGEVVGFHSSAGADAKGVPLYDAHISIFDSDGRKMYEDVADRNVYAPLQDFFFVVPTQQMRLIYVRNSDEIIAVTLS